MQIRTSLDPARPSKQTFLPDFITPSVAEIDLLVPTSINTDSSPPQTGSHVPQALRRPALVPLDTQFEWSSHCLHLIQADIAKSTDH